MDMTKERRTHRPLFICGLEVEPTDEQWQMSSPFLGVYISDDYTCTLNTTQLVKKAQQWLYFLRRLRKSGMSPRILSNFYGCIIESILTSCITLWYGRTIAMDRKRLQRVVKAAERSTIHHYPLQDIYHCRVHRRACSIVEDLTHPQHRLFTPLPSGRRYRSVKCRMSRLRNSFYPPASDCITLTGPDTTLDYTQTHRSFSSHCSGLNIWQIKHFELWTFYLISEPLWLCELWRFKQQTMCGYFNLWQRLFSYLSPP